MNARKLFGWILVLVLLTLALAVSNATTNAQGPSPRAPSAPRANAGTALTYQGSLKVGGVPANGTYDFFFELYDAENGGTFKGSNSVGDVVVTNGYFTTPIDFGEGDINGDARWLKINIRLGASTGGYTPLTPRQQLTPAPIALSLPGLYTQQNATSPNIIGGYSGNSVTAGVYGATISGGGYAANANSVGSSYGTIGGGYKNTSGLYSTIGGGHDNNANLTATIGGGSENTANWGATIGGGYHNTAESPSTTIGGGYFNTASGEYATIGGGSSNTASGYYATVSGGEDNTAAGTHSFAAGHKAVANHDGAFVWADSTGVPITSTVSNQFIIRAGGGVGVNTANTIANALTVNGRIIAGGTGNPAPAGAEPFVTRGSYSGISMEDRSDADLRWVVYPKDGSLRFYNGSDRVSISSTGVVYIGALGAAGATTLCRNASGEIASCSSSARYKNNIASLNLGLDTIAQLRPVTFAWNETGEPDLGFVAEEVDAVTSLLATRNDQGQVEGVKYDRVSAVLVKAMQEQQMQIETLQTQNAALETRLVALEQALQVNQPNSPDNPTNLAMLLIGGLVGFIIAQRGIQRGGK